MDSLETALREDAEKIKAEVSPELDARIRASLESVSQQASRGPERRARPMSLWLASSLTGIAAASLVIVLINLDRPGPPPVSTDRPMAIPPLMPELKTETAVFIGPLQEELDNLESDLRKAERAVKEEIGLTL